MGDLVERLFEAVELGNISRSFNDLSNCPSRCTRPQIRADLSPRSLASIFGRDESRTTGVFFTTLATAIATESCDFF